MLCLTGARVQQERTFLKSSNVKVNPIDSIKKPSKPVNRPLLHHATDSGRLIPMAAPRQTCTGYYDIAGVSVT